MTGSVSGIGLAIAKELAQRGIKIALNDIHDPDSSLAKEAFSVLERNEEAARYYPCDITNYSNVKQMVDRIVEDFGQLDILVNNAGILGKMLPITELSIDDWNAVINVDLTGTFLVTKAVVPHMIKANFGRIINMSSIAGKEGNPNQTPYAAAKSGILGLTRALAKELAGYDIRVNAVCPALIKTSMVGGIPSEQREHLLSLIPVGRFGEVEEVADLVCFLALSRAANFITGQAFNITGGRADY